MPTNAKILIRVQTELDEGFIKKIRTEFLQEMNLIGEDFYTGGPFVLVKEKDREYMPVRDDNSTWLDMNIWRSYFGEGYTRGDGEFFIKCAEWLENRIPGCLVYYGHDVNDKNMSLFDKPARDRLRSLVFSKISEE